MPYKLVTQRCLIEFQILVTQKITTKTQRCKEAQRKNLVLLRDLVVLWF